MNSSKRNCSGPPISTTPFSGAPAAVLPTARATSSAAMGWNSTCGIRTVSPSVAPSAIRAAELEELRRVDDRVGDPGVPDELLLPALRAQVAAVGHALRPDDRQRDVVRDPRRLLGVEEVARGRLEELHDVVVRERRRVRHVHDDLGALHGVGETLAGQRVDARVRRAGTTSWPCSSSLAATFEPISPLAPMTTIFMVLLPVVRLYRGDHAGASVCDSGAPSASGRA